MSDYVVHFTRSQVGVGAYDAMLSIRSTQNIEARSAFGCATNVTGLGRSQHWEREWRVPADLSFSTGEAAFLFVPEVLHPAAKSFLATDGNGTGPAYACPILDPLSSDERIQHALQGLAAQ